jgi:hypothetical protein
MSTGTAALVAFPIRRELGVHVTLGNTASERVGWSVQFWVTTPRGQQRLLRDVLDFDLGKLRTLRVEAAQPQSAQTRTWGKFPKSSAKTDKVQLWRSLTGYVVTAECAGVDTGEREECIHMTHKNA